MMLAPDSWTAGGTMRHDGGLVIALGAALALAVAIYNYLSPVAFLAPQASVAGTPGAALVVFSTAVLAAAGLILGGRTGSRALVGFLMVGALVAILGTGLAAWLLESPAILALMGLCSVGWILRALQRRPSVA
jgi:hypothetical protein